MFGGAFFEEFIHLPLAVRTANITAAAFKSGRARGCLFTIYVKTAGTSTFQFRVSATNPIENQGWVPTVNVSMTTAGVYVVIVHPRADLQPPGEAADTTAPAVLQCCRIPVPAICRGSIIKGDASEWEFGITARRLP